MLERPINTAMAGTHAFTSCWEKVKVLKALPALPIAMNSKALLRAEEAKAEVCSAEARVLGMPEAHSVCAAELVLVESEGWEKAMDAPEAMAVGGSSTKGDCVVVEVVVCCCC